jgi:uncharacterized membrane protein
MRKRAPRRPARLHMTAAAPRLRQDEFPAVSSFVRGYLHEDFSHVHGSAHAAAVAFCADASPNERRQLAEELQALVRRAATTSVRDLRRFVTRDLGSRWEPKSPDELAELLDLIRVSTE